MNIDRCICNILKNRVVLNSEILPIKDGEGYVHIFTLLVPGDVDCPDELRIFFGKEVKAAINGIYL